MPKATNIFKAILQLTTYKAVGEKPAHRLEMINVERLKELKKKWIASKGKDKSLEPEIIKLCNEQGLNPDNFFNEMYAEVVCMGKE